jgi:hypothetical protein
MPKRRRSFPTPQEEGHRKIREGDVSGGLEGGRRDYKQEQGSDAPICGVHQYL